MDRRTKILGTLFGVFIAYAVVAQVVYPTWIEPLVTIDDIIAERSEALGELEDQAQEVFDAKMEFREYVNRVGAFDIRKVENDLRDRLNTLIATHNIQEANVTPSRPTDDRKTGLGKMTITVSGVGTLKSAVLFLRDVAELPHMVRVLNPLVYPVSTSRTKDKGKRAREETLVSLRVPIQVLVMPQKEIVGRLDPKTLKRPDAVVRHSERNFTPIWDRTPFTPYVKLDPVVVTATKPKVDVEKGKKRVYLDVKATGGDGEYTFEWRPSSGLSNGSSPKPLLDTASTGKRSYTCVVTDGRGTVATCHIDVEVKEKPKPPEKVVAKPPERVKAVDPGPQRFRDGAKMQFTSTWISSHGSDRAAEMAVYDSKSKQTEYYTAGDEFDGGTLTYVHQSGALVLRRDSYYVYPVGAQLNEDLPIESALEFPRLRQVADYHRSAVEEAHRAVAEEEAARQAAEAAEAEAAQQAAEAAQVEPKTDDAAGGDVPESVKAAAQDAPKSGAVTAAPGGKADTGDAESGKAGKPGAKNAADRPTTPSSTGAKPAARTPKDNKTAKPTAGSAGAAKPGPATGKPAASKKGTPAGGAPVNEPRTVQLKIEKPADKAPAAKTPAEPDPKTGSTTGAKGKAPAAGRAPSKPAAPGAKKAEPDTGKPRATRTGGPAGGGLSQVRPSTRPAHRRPGDKARNEAKKEAKKEGKTGAKPPAEKPGKGNQKSPDVNKSGARKGKPPVGDTGGKDAKKTPNDPGTKEKKQGGRKQEPGKKPGGVER